MASGGAFVILLDEIATMVKAAVEPADKIINHNNATPDGAYKRRDLSIIIDVARGSLRNKSILVPAALALNYLMPWAVVPLLAAGGTYFAYEGVKKVQCHLRGGERSHAPKPKDGEHHEDTRARKVQAAIKTDMILSGEITAVTLATVATLPLATQAMVMGGVALGATVGVYTVIAGIIKMEDVGAWLAHRKGENIAAAGARKLGQAILDGKPHVLKGISYAGTTALFMVAGGLLFHGLPMIGHLADQRIGDYVTTEYMHSFAKLGAAFLTGAVTGSIAAPVIDRTAHAVRKLLRPHQKQLSAIWNRASKKAHRLPRLAHLPHRGAKVSAPEVIAPEVATPEAVAEQTPALDLPAIAQPFNTVANDNAEAEKAAEQSVAATKKDIHWNLSFMPDDKGFTSLDVWHDARGKLPAPPKPRGDKQGGGPG